MSDAEVRSRARAFYADPADEDARTALLTAERRAGMKPFVVLSMVRGVCPYQVVRWVSRGIPAVGGHAYAGVILSMGAAPVAWDTNEPGMPSGIFGSDEATPRLILSVLPFTTQT